MRILCIGDIVGRPGRSFLNRELKTIRRERAIDFVIANAENAAAGSGVTPKIFRALCEAGVDVLTTGDHIFKNKEIFDCIDEPPLLRPLNYVPAARGHGTGVFQAGDARVGVVNLAGRVFLEPAECPFRAIDDVLPEMVGQTDLVFVDMHAEATSEKIAMGWHLDGRVTAVFGTHTHVQTADERLLPNGTAYITDLGMTGPYDSVLGRDKRSVLHKFTTQMPARFDVARYDVRASGVIVEADPATGRARSVERVQFHDETTRPEDEEETGKKPKKT